MSESARLAETSHIGNYGAASAEGEVTSQQDASQTAPAAPHETQRQGMFPVEPFWWLGELLPGQYPYLPSYVRKVHSFPHLVLLTGMLANCGLFVQLVFSWKYWEEEEHGPWDYVVVIASCLFAVISLQLLHAELVQYSIDLHESSVEAQKSKDQMMSTFNGMVCDLDTMLAKSADTQAALAERSLDSHRRDLHNFLLKGISTKVRRMQEFPTMDFIAFLALYLKIFEECSAYPLDEPFIIATKDEVLEGCASIGEVVELVGKRAKGMEVKFLRKQVDGAKKRSSTLRQKWRKVVHVPRKVLLLTGLSQFVKTKQGEVEGKNDTSPDEEMSLPKGCSGDAKQEIKWLRFDLNGGFVIHVEEDDPFPIQIKGGFFTCTVLSPEHARLLFSFFIGVPLLLMNIMLVRPPYTVVIGNMLVTLICITFVLHDFLDIDAIQRLEVQIKEMQAAVQAVEERRQYMLDFFSRVHRLSDFWLFRTLPRLELMKLCGDALEDAEDAKMAPLLVDIVSKVSNLEEALLPTELWQSEGLTDAEKKKTSVPCSEHCSRSSSTAMCCLFVEFDHGTEHECRALGVQLVLLPHEDLISSSG
ncbi:unnamed protein product [Durusdinium trenchii]|uniref:Uncharacterized protein n=1 Tax=Durusdinium trenchii TaxID=1381693 RepID=A0ABP0QLY4_9DINO